MVAINCLVFAVGVFAVSFFNQLCSPWWLLLALPLAGYWRVAVVRQLLALGLGLAYGLSAGERLVERELPVEWELQPLRVTGVVAGLPQRDSRRSRFEFQVERCHTPAGQSLPVTKLLLSWYDLKRSVEPGQRYRLAVVLRRPRGFANPGGFDYRGWLLRRGLSASGYVRSSPQNQLLDSRAAGFSTWRYRLRAHLQQGQYRNLAVLQALSIGDGSALGVEHWSLLRRTGTVHLLVVSGLHIGFFALLCYGLGAALGRLVNLGCYCCPASLVAALMALAGALSYAGLSGFGLPAVRALVMVAVVLAVKLSRSRFGAAAGLAVAAAVIALIDPLAIHSGGFWLSFGAVAALLWVMGGLWGQLGWWQRLWRPQWVVFVALAVVLLINFAELPLLSPVVNAVLIPWVSLLIVPCCVVAAAVSSLLPAVAEWLWLLADWQLDWVWRLLAWAANASDPLVVALPTVMSAGLVLALLVPVVLGLLPRGLPGRWLAALPLLSLLLIERERSALELTVLDVGQGLAVVLRTRHHTLVYDTGARFSDRFDAGSGVVAPYLRARGIHRVDRLVISHGDGDHAGGVAGLMRSLPVAEVMSAEPLPGVSSRGCRAGLQWQWDGVSFAVLAPQPPLSASRNNRSCVLLVRYRDQAILLPGDIEREQEQWLLANAPLPTPLALLVAPHHGSKTSSSLSFVRYLQPQRVIYSAGYRHQYGHPHPQVVARYRQLGSTEWRTADSGAINLRWHDGSWQCRGWRDRRRYYWQWHPGAGRGQP